MANLDSGVRVVHLRLDLEDTLDLLYIKFLLAVDPAHVPEVWAIIDTRLDALRRES
jgi:hypothetical protein